jgi:sigma-E factor negative regulatory protein RseB
MRYGLLLAAATTVAVPGLLAALGVVGHDHVAATAGTAVAGVAAGAAVLSGPFPVAPAAARAGVRDDVAGVQRTSGPTVTVFSRLSGRQQALGRKLLARAASAGQALSYRGTERISQTGVDGTVSLTSTVWHQGGQVLIRRTASWTGTAVAPAGTPADTASRSSAGVLGITRSLVTLLGQHYVAVYAGSGSAAGRTAAVVELYHFNGMLAARYWLDRQTMLPLRRVLFGSSDQVISDDAFVRVALGSSAAAAPAQAVTQSQPAWVTATSAARFRSALAARGWRLPSTLSGGLPLYAAAWTGRASGQVADLEYSDGLYTVSLFVQPGHLAANLPGAQRMLVGGQRAYVYGHAVTWAGPGLVYTMIADAPAQTVEQVVAALPAGSPPGLLARMGRGLGRLARAADPFD